MAERGRCTAERGRGGGGPSSGPGVGRSKDISADGVDVRRGSTCGVTGGPLIRAQEFSFLPYRSRARARGCVCCVSRMRIEESRGGNNAPG